MQSDASVDQPQRLRIAFIGNTNNYPFMVARALRREGHDVTFYLDRPEGLHRPEGRYADIAVPYPDWIVDISGFRMRHILLASDTVQSLRRACKDYDLVVMNGLGPAIVGGSHSRTFSLLTGSDLEFLANWSSVGAEFTRIRRQHGLARALASSVVMARAVQVQRRAIRRSKGVNYFAPGLAPVGDKLLAELCTPLQTRTSFMLSNVETIELLPRAYSTTPSKLRIFNVARLNWRTPKPAHLTDLDMKGTDILLGGFAQFLREGGEGTLVLVRKGADIVQTEKLVQDLQIGDHVTWLNEMTQADVMEQYRLADVVIEQLSTSVVGMGGLDALASGRPVIANARPETFDALLGMPTAILHATTVSHVSNHLRNLARNPSYWSEVALRSRRYVEDHFSPTTAARQILHATSGHAA